MRKLALDTLSLFKKDELAEVMLDINYRKLSSFIHKLYPKYFDTFLEMTDIHDKALKRTIRLALFNVHNKLKSDAKERVCIEHFTRFTSQKKRSGIVRIPFYACRKCGKTEDSLPEIRQIRALFDRAWEGKSYIADGIMFVNYLKFSKEFDFECIELKNTTDFDVKNFCSKISPKKKNWYSLQNKKMECLIHNSCNISRSTKSILENHFRLTMID